MKRMLRGRPIFSDNNRITDAAPELAESAEICPRVFLGTLNQISMRIAVSAIRVRQRAAMGRGTGDRTRSHKEEK